jgi:hypothetical protein
MLNETKVKSIPSNWDKKTKIIEVRLCMEDATGILHITDLMLQGGKMPILWNGHVSEIRFSFEEEE